MTPPCGNFHTFLNPSLKAHIWQNIRALKQIKSILTDMLVAPYWILIFCIIYDCSLKVAALARRAKGSIYSHRGRTQKQKLLKTLKTATQPRPSSTGAGAWGSPARRSGSALSRGEQRSKLIAMMWDSAVGVCGIIVPINWRSQRMKVVRVADAVARIFSALVRREVRPPLGPLRPPPRQGLRQPPDPPDLAAWTRVLAKLSWMEASTRTATSAAAGMVMVSSAPKWLVTEWSYLSGYLYFSSFSNWLLIG